MHNAGNSVTPAYAELPLNSIQQSIYNRMVDPRQSIENLNIANDVLYISSNNVTERMNKFFEHYPKLKKLVESQLIINCSKEFFYDAIDNIKELPDLDTYLYSETKDLYYVILTKTLYTDEFNKKLEDEEFRNKWISCLKIVDTIVWPEHGEHEILLNFFIKNGKMMPGSDINVEGHKIEAKKPFGMLKGAQTPQHPKIIFNTVKNFIKDEVNESVINKLAFGGIRNIKKSIELLSEESNLTLQEITYYIAIGYFSQYFLLSDITKFNMFLQNIKFDYNNITNLASQIFRIHGVLSVINYQITDNWEYLFVCDNDSGRYEVIKSFGADNILDVNWKYYMELFTNKNIGFTGGPRAKEDDSDVRHYNAGIKLN